MSPPGSRIVLVIVGLLPSCMFGESTVVGDRNEPEPGDDDDGSDAPDDTYAWIVGEPGACSIVCGGGTQSRTVTCVDSNGNVVADSMCTSLRPDDVLVCNTQSCTNITCTSQFSTQQFTASSATSGTAPLTVTFNAYILSTIAWDIIDFGDGTTSQGINLQFVANYACVNHTYTRPGTFSAGRSLIGGDPQFYPRPEVSVTVQ